MAVQQKVLSTSPESHDLVGNVWILQREMAAVARDPGGNATRRPLRIRQYCRDLTPAISTENASRGRSRGPAILK